jgi:predicted nucleic acid-binding protein
VALICDTGPLYAAMDRSDADHEPCAELLRTFGEPLLVPAPVVVELDWLAASRLGPQPFVEFLEDVARGALRIVDPVAADYARARELLVEYRDLALGLVDAVVVSVVERLDEPKLATLDHRHFTAVRVRHVDALQLLPA